MPDELSAEADARSIEDMLGLDNPAAVIARDPRFNIAPAPPRKGIIERNMPRSFDPSGQQQAQQSIAQGAVTATGFDELQDISEGIQQGDYGNAIGAAVAASAANVIPFPGAKQAPKVATGVRGYYTTPNTVTKFGQQHKDMGGAIPIIENRHIGGPGGEHWQNYLHNWKNTEGKPVYSNRERTMAERLYANQFDQNRAIAETANIIKPGREALDSNIRNIDTNYNEVRKALGEEELIKSLYQQGARPGPNTYEVAINANPEDFMHLGQRVKDQKIFEAISQMMHERPVVSMGANEHYGANMTGKQLFDLLGYDAINQPRHKALDVGEANQALTGAMEELARYGIPGTRRVDSISRGNETRRLTGKHFNNNPDTHIYDVNDPSLLSIRDKLYGGGAIGAGTMSGFTEQQAAEQ